MLNEQDGEQRLASYVVGCLPGLKVLVLKAKDHTGTLIYFVNEKKDETSTLYVASEDAKQVADAWGVSEAYTFMLAINRLVPQRIVPVLAELHTPQDKVYRAVTQIFID